MPMRYALICLAVVVASCSSPTPSPSPPPPTPAPVAPPAPVFPSVAGTWTGTFSSTLAILNHNISNTGVCNTRWSITQSAGTFSGTLALTSSTATNASTCSGGLTYTGTVTTVGVVNLDIIWPFDDAVCGLTKTSQTMAGTVRGAVLSLKQQDTWLCSGGTVQIDRTLLIDLTR